MKFSARPLTLLSLGLGRDSMTILALLMEGKCMVLGKKVALQEIDGVVFSDTGAEWPFTLSLIPEVQQACARAGVPFFWLKKPPMKEVVRFERVFQRQLQKLFKRRGRPRKGFYPAKGAQELSRAAGPLYEAAPWRRRKYRSIQSKAESGGYHARIPIEQEMSLLARIATRSSKECTVTHKIEPIRELLNDLLVQRYQMSLVDWGAGVSAGMLEPNRMLLGLAADEVGRLQTWNPPPLKMRGGKFPAAGAIRWAVRDVYPLVEAKITKAKEAGILRRHGWNGVRKSGCQSCPFQGWQWFWVLSRRHPQRFADIAFMEQYSLKTRKGYGLSPMYLRGDQRPIAEEVRHKVGSRLAFWDMQRKGKLTPAFIRKVQAVDPNWPGPKSNMSVARLPERLKRELEDIVLDKGYARACSFGDK